MSEKQHTIDAEELKGLHKKAGGTDGGACLNRHVGYQPRHGKDNSCSHRWQSWKKMCEHKDLYNGEKYESLTATIKTAAYEKDGKKVPSWYEFELKKPAPNEWDVGEGKNKDVNFFGPCYTPYWHEAHHIVPNSNLRNAILGFEKGKFAMTIRKGLLEEKYNLNHMVNMITLPMDKEVADALKLPRHRQTAKYRNHAAYGKNVQNKLKDFLKTLKKQLKKHEKPGYEALKVKIEDLSDQLFNQIKDSGAASLDEMKKGDFDVPVTSRPSTTFPT